MHWTERSPGSCACILSTRMAHGIIALKCETCRKTIISQEIRKIRAFDKKIVKNSNGRAQREYISCASKTNTIFNGCNYKAAPLHSPTPLISNLESCQKHLNLNTLMAAMPTLSFFKKKKKEEAKLLLNVFRFELKHVKNA